MSAALVALSFALAGCGGSSGSSGAHSASASAGGSGQAGSAGGAGGSPPGAPGSAKPARLPGGTVARVDGTAIRTAAYQQQLQLSAPAPVRALIANPSDIAACTAALKSREEQVNRILQGLQGLQAKYAKQLKGTGAPGGPAPARRERTEAQRRTECDMQLQSARQQALSTLIRRQWTRSQARELGVSVSQQEIAKQVKAREASRRTIAKDTGARALGLAEGLAALEGPRYTTAELRELVEDELLEAAIYTRLREKLTRPGPVSAHSIERYFSEHRAAYARPEERTVVVASTPSRTTATAILSERSRGALTSIAARHSLATTRRVIPCDHSRPPATVASSPLLAAVCAASRSAITGPVKLPGGYEVLQVLATTPARTESSAQARAAITRLLAAAGQERRLAILRTAAEAKLRAATQCAAGYIAPPCSEFTASR